jgi:protein-tyrosine phosphatase
MRIVKTLIVAVLVICLMPFADPARANEPVKIAFVDTGNTGRSVTAEALADAIIHDQQLHIAVISRAVDLDPFFIKPEANAATLLMQHGIDVSAHRAAQLDANDVRHADLIITMTAKHKDRVIALFPDAGAKTFTIAEYATGTPSDVVDAYGKPMDVYEQVFEQISGYMPVVLDKSSRK